MTRQIYTLQMAQWRHADKLGVKRIDATVRSGIPFLAPTWGLLDDYKGKRITDDIYVERYYQMLYDRYLDAPGAFERVLDGEQPIGLMCYCGWGKFCHRHLLTSFYENNFDCEWLGEIAPEGIVTERPKLLPYSKWVSGRGRF